MGRTDEVQFMLECVAEWRRLGARVTFEPGWETRGNGLHGNYEGGIVHHTASNSSAAKPNPTRNILINGRPDLTGPLCNVTGPWCTDNDPWLHVIAAFPANHAGASGGKSMGPLPVTGLFNPRVVGLEVDYAGTTPMTGGQRKAALIFTRGLTNVLKRSTEYVRAHAETSVTGKWDAGYAPGKTYDMATFRRDAASVQPGATPATPAPQEESDMYLISAVGRGIGIIGDGSFAPLGYAEDEVEIMANWLRVPVREGNARQWDVARDVALRMRGASDVSDKLNALAAQVAGIKPTDVDEAAFAALLAPMLTGVTTQQISDALREVLRTGTGAGPVS